MNLCSYQFDKEKGMASFYQNGKKKPLKDVSLSHLLFYPLFSLAISLLRADLVGAQYTISPSTHALFCLCKHRASSARLGCCCERHRDKLSVRQAYG
jgi:hypothetical protein